MRINNRTTRRVALLGALIGSGMTLLPTSQAATPWALIARRAIGRVEQLSQAPKGDQPGFDVATVILNADATKVYATAVAMLRKSQRVHIVAEDAAHRTVEFGNDQRSAGITVTRSRHAAVAASGGIHCKPRSGFRDNAGRGWRAACLPGDEGDMQRAA